MIPRAEVEQRLANIRVRLREERLDGALFVYPIDVYYFTGTRQNAVLWVPGGGQPTLLVRKSLSRALQESLVEDVRPFPASKELPAIFGPGSGRIGLTFDVLPVQQYQYYAGLLKEKEFVDISSVNRDLRSVKSPWELGQMETSGSLLDNAFAQIPRILKPGMRELDFAASFDYLLRTSGSDGYLRIRAFHQDLVGLAVAGGNASLPGCFDGAVTGKGLSTAAPYGPSTDVIEAGSPLMVDYGLIYNGYIVDVTRIFSFGPVDAELGRAFRTALDIQGWLIENLRPGAVCEDLFSGAARLAEEAGLGDRFMGHPGEQSKFVGHGVGLELDELPVLAPRFKAPVRAGQTIAIEPKFVFPGRGVVGIENTVVVTETGCERLTHLADDMVIL